jgi:hypothetical protein
MKTHPARIAALVSSPHRTEELVHAMLVDRNIVFDVDVLLSVYDHWLSESSRHPLRLALQSRLASQPPGLNESWRSVFSGPGAIDDVFANVVSRSTLTRVDLSLIAKKRLAVLALSDIAGQRLAIWLAADHELGQDRLPGMFPYVLGVLPAIDHRHLLSQDSVVRDCLSLFLQQELASPDPLDLTHTTKMGFFLVCLANHPAVMDYLLDRVQMPQSWIARAMTHASQGSPGSSWEQGMARLSQQAVWPQICAETLSPSCGLSSLEAWPPGWHVTLSDLQLSCLGQALRHCSVAQLPTELDVLVEMPNLSFVAPKLAGDLHSSRRRCLLMGMASSVGVPGSTAQSSRPL